MTLEIIENFGAECENCEIITGFGVTSWPCVDF